MSKEKVKHLSAVLTSVFAHAGHISKEEAKEISGLADREFEKNYNRAAEIVDKVMKHEGDKMDKFLEHFSEEIDRWIAETGGKLFA
jgi:ElaB/YqjD/DUF883 family membrane-anchored ribosome-binding protein